MVLELALGLWLASLFHLDGLDRAITILSACAPAGLNIVHFASSEKVDRDYAATLAASCMVASMILVPVLLTIL